MVKASSEFSAAVTTSATTSDSATVSAKMEALIGEVPPEFRSHYEMWQEIRHERDRGAAILAAAYLDDRLNDAIMSAFYVQRSTAEHLLKPNGYLGSYAAKCQIGYCLGLFEKNVKQTLDTIGEIRNLFAHSKQSLSFNDPDIVTLCSEIKIIGKPFIDINPDSPNRGRYMNAAQCIGLILAIEMTRDDQPKRKPPRVAD